MHVVIRLHAMNLLTAELIIHLANEVDVSKVKLEAIKDEDRYRLFNYVINKYGEKALGYDKTTIYRVKKKQRKVTDNMLRKILSLIKEDEFSKIIGVGKRLESLGIIRDGVIDYGIVSEILAYARNDPILKSLIVRFVVENMPNEIPIVVKVTKKHVEKFKKVLKNKSEKTAKDRLRYLEKALDELEWELTPEKLDEYIIEKLDSEGVHVATHIAKSLKLFIKEVIKDDKLYRSFKIPKANEELVATNLTIDEVVKVARAIDDLTAKTYFILLAETGLRPGELLNLKVTDLNLKERIINVMRVSGSKRAYISFIHVETRDFIAKEYLPYRRQRIEIYENHVGRIQDRSVVTEWKSKLFPMKDRVIRQIIYEAMDEALGHRFRLYDLRVFFATYMTKQGVPPQVINILQGRAPPREFKVMQQHYLALSIEDLREYYDKYAPKICERLRLKKL